MYTKLSLWKREGEQTHKKAGCFAALVEEV